MSGWWISDLFHAGRHAELISWIFWVILSITLHELAHGWAALWQGDPTPRQQGRMTANPLVHMGPWSLLVFAVIGIAWGMMPTDPSRYRWGRRGRVVVAGAGPAMNIALAVVSLTALAIWLALGPSGHLLYRNLAVFLWTGGWLNLLLAALNLLPVPPLDGSQILAGLSWWCYRMLHHPNAQFAALLLVMVIFVTPVGSYMFMVGGIAAMIYVDTLGAILGNPPVFEVVL